MIRHQAAAQLLHDFFLPLVASGWFSQQCGQLLPISRSTNENNIFELGAYSLINTRKGAIQSDSARPICQSNKH